LKKKTVEGDVMYCPNCATQADSKQKFCRQCGQDLNMVEQVLKGQTVVAAWNRAAALWGLTSCITGTVLGCIMKVLSKEGIHLGGAFMPYVMAAAVVMAIGGMGLMIYAFLPAMKVQHLSKPTGAMGKLTDTQPDLLAAAPATIMEHTTRIFEEEARAVAPVITTDPL
jgi:hypothetical protein